MTFEKTLQAVQFLGSCGRTFGTLASGETLRVERYEAGGRQYRVVLARRDGFRVVLDTLSSVAVAECVAAYLA